MTYFDESKNEEMYNLAKTMNLQDEVYVHGTWSKNYNNLTVDNMMKIQSGAVLPGSHELTSPTDFQTYFGQLGKLTHAFLTKKENVEVGKRANLTFKVGDNEYLMTYNYLSANQKTQLDALVANKKYTVDNAFVSRFSENLQLVGLDSTTFTEESITEGDKVAVTKGELVFPVEVHKDDIIQLPATGTVFPDVTITYTYDPADPSSLIQISGNQATVLDVAAETVLKITATFTCGSVSETKEYQITIKPGVAAALLDFTQDDVDTWSKVSGAGSAKKQETTKDGVKITVSRGMVKKIETAGDKAFMTAITKKDGGSDTGYITFDLSSKGEPVGKMTMSGTFWKNDKKYTKELKLEYSTDGVNWTELKSILGDYTGNVVSEHTYDFAGKNAKYIRIKHVTKSTTSNNRFGVTAVKFIA